MQPINTGSKRLHMDWKQKLQVLDEAYEKEGGLTQWWCYLAICDKITTVTKLCWGDIIIIKYGSSPKVRYAKARQQIEHRLTYRTV